MGFLEAAVTLGTLMGTFLSSYVFAVVGYVGVFGSCSGIVAIVAIYTFFLIPESVQVKQCEVGDDRKIPVQTNKFFFTGKPPE